MAALFPKIYDIIDQNPNKYATLRWREPTSTEGLTPELWDTFSLKPLSPPGALSMVCMLVDPMFEMGSFALRKQILMEQLLVLHQRVDTELIGRRYPRKKIQDLLAGQISAKSPPSSALLEDVLCELFQLQKIHCHRRTKTISFSPPDLRLWSSERKILVGEEDNCWFLTPSKEQSLREWITQKEDEGWTITWPTATAKMEEIQAELASRGIQPDRKMKKDDLAKVLGRAQALTTISTFQLTTS